MGWRTVPPLFHKVLQIQTYPLVKVKWTQSTTGTFVFYQMMGNDEATYKHQKNGLRKIYQRRA